MSELDLRVLQPGDSEEIAALWQSCFGDSRELVSAFLGALSKEGAGLGAFYGERLAGMAYVVTGLKLNYNGKSESCSYVYAVATKEEYRRQGIAERLCGLCAEKSRELGCEIILSKPVSERLYGYYSRVLGIWNNLFCSSKIITAPEEDFALPEITPVSAAGYYKIREESLSAVPHLSVSENWLEFEKALCLDYGGDLFSVGGSPAAAYIEDGRLRIKELICPPEEIGEKASVLCRYLNAPEAELYLPGETGAKYLAANIGGIPPLCHFGILFD